MNIRDKKNIEITNDLEIADNCQMKNNQEEEKDKLGLSCASKICTPNVHLKFLVCSIFRGCCLNTSSCPKDHKEISSKK